MLFNIKESVTLSDISQADDDRRVIAALVQSGANSFTEQFPKDLIPI